MLPVKKKKYLFISFFVLKLSDLNFDGFFIFICTIICTLITITLNRLVYLFVKQYCFTGHDFKRKWSYNPGQNIRQIVRKLNMDETRKIWYSILPKFWPLVPKIHFCWGDWTLVCSPRDFKIFLLFPKILSLKSFSNSWGSLYKNLIILEIKSRFTWDKSN